MSTLTDTRTVGEIAAQYPQAPHVFERHGLDYCCGGKLPLAEACAQRGLDPQRLLDEITAAEPHTPETDWSATPLNELIEHILGKHHEYLKSEMPRLTQIMAKVMAAHGANHGDVLAALENTYGGLRAELESHMAKEEMILFPLIRSMEVAASKGEKAAPAHCGSINNPIRVMEYEHDSAGEALAAMRRFTSGYTLPPDACNTFRALYWGLQELESDLHRHIHLENNILFPRASRLEAGLVSAE